MLNTTISTHSMATGFRVLAEWLDGNPWVLGKLTSPTVPVSVGIPLTSPEAVNAAAITFDGHPTSFIDADGVAHTSTQVRWDGVRVHFFHLAPQVRDVTRSVDAVEPHELLEPVSVEVTE